MTEERCKDRKKRAESDGKRPRSRLSQHEDVDACTDEICCCEAEPRWQRLAEENEAKAAAERKE